MDKFKAWTAVFYDSLNTYAEKALEVIPIVLFSILIFFLGWLFARVVSTIVARLLKTLKFDELSEKLNVKEYLVKANVKLSPSQLIGKMIYWILMLLVFVTASDALGLERVSSEISKLLGYLPNLFLAGIFFFVGTFIAGFVRDLIHGATSSIGISSGKIIGNFVFYFLFMIVSITALDQAGLDTTIITSNLLLIIGTILLAAGVSYGFASRDILSNILAGFFSRRTFHVGQTIEIDGIRGKIIDTNNISVILLTGKQEKVVIPIKELITQKVKIIGAIASARPMEE